MSSVIPSDYAGYPAGVSNSFDKNMQDLGLGSIAHYFDGAFGLGTMAINNFPWLAMTGVGLVMAFRILPVIVAVL